MPRRDRLYPLILGLVRTIWWAQGLKFTVTGAQHIPATGGAILAMNHVSYMDYTFGGLPARRHKRLVRFVAKREIFDNPVAGALMRGMHHISVDRAHPAAAYAQIVQYLREGELVGIFPEGTVGLSFEIGELRTGAARLAAEAQVPIIPIVFWGGQRQWAKGKRRHMGRTHTPISIDVGEPIRVPSGTAETDVAAVTAQLRARLTAQLHAVQERYNQDHGPFEAGLWWQPHRLGGAAPTPAEAAAVHEQARAEILSKRQSG